MRILSILLCWLLVGPMSAATYYVSTTGSDSNNCTASGTACLTLNGALGKAAAGDTISVATGTYAAQTITATKPSPGVTVQCATDYACVIGTNVSAGGSWYTLQGFKVDSGTTNHGQGYSISGSNITFRNFKLYGRYVAGYVQAGASNFLWDGGEWGDPNDLGSRNCANSDGYYMYMLGDTTISNVTLQGITVNPQKLDATACAGDPLHMETIRIDGNISTMLIDRFIFLDGMQDNTGTIFITTFRGTPSGITIRNSYLGTDGNSSIVFSGTSNNINILYNTIAGGISFAAGTPTSLAIKGNAGWWQSYAGCTGTHVNNVWQWDSNFTCGTDTIVTGPQFSLSNLGLTGGYTVSAGSPLINAGETTCAPTTDIRGYTRPASTACDAGAFEYGASSPVRAITNLPAGRVIPSGTVHFQ